MTGFTKVLVNDSAADATNLILLPVEVVTKWGLTQFWADVAAGLIGLVGFLATLPLIGWLWKWYTNNKTAEG